LGLGSGLDLELGSKYTTKYGKSGVFNDKKEEMITKRTKDKSRDKSQETTKTRTKTQKKRKKYKRQR
jgi:hypothetical protein